MDSQINSNLLADISHAPQEGLSALANQVLTDPDQLDELLDIIISLMNRDLSVQSEQQRGYKQYII